MEGSTGTRQYLTQPTTRVPINEFKFQWSLLNQARAAHVVSSIGRKTMNLIFNVTNVWFHLPAFPCIPRWLVPFPRNSTYDWFQFFNVWLVQFSSMTDNVQVMVVSPSWLSPRNGLSIQTGSSQVMWFLRPYRHSWMASPPRLAAPRWCGSSALTITAEWSPHPDW